MAIPDFDPNFLNRIRGVVDGVMSSVQASGVNIRAHHVVEIVSVTRIGARPAAGSKGESHYDRKRIEPNPPVKYTGKWIQDSVSGSRMLQGDVTVEQIPQLKFTREQLMRADFWLIDGEAFKVLNAGVDDPEQNCIFWRAVLKRAQQGEVDLIDLTRSLS